MILPDGSDFNVRVHFRPWALVIYFRECAESFGSAFACQMHGRGPPALGKARVALLCRVILYRDFS